MDGQKKTTKIQNIFNSIGHYDLDKLLIPATLLAYW